MSTATPSFEVQRYGPSAWLVRVCDGQGNARVVSDRIETVDAAMEFIAALRRATVRLLPPLGIGRTKRQRTDQETSL